MTTLTKSIALALLAGTVVAANAQSVDIPPRGPIPFSAYDRDGSGAISEQEFASVRAERMAARAAAGRPTRNAPGAVTFAALDIDGNRQLSPEELVTMQRARMQRRFENRGPGMGRGRSGPGAGMKRNMPDFADFDLNNDGTLGEDEFYEARNKRISERARQGYLMRGFKDAQSFSEIDGDGNGVVTPDEFALAQASHRQSRRD